MSAKLSERESELAGKLGRLQGAKARPSIENGGMIGEALNFISAHVPPVLIQLALVSP